MHISDVITQLEKLKKKHGDLAVLNITKISVCKYNGEDTAGAWEDRVEFIVESDVDYTVV